MKQPPGTYRRYLMMLMLFICTPAMAGEEPVVRLSELLAAMDSVTGKFEQVITDEEDFVVEENTGSFALKRPGYFRWHVDPPFEKLLVSNGDKLWTYDPDLEQVTVEPVADKLLESPLLLFSGDPEKIRDRYAVTPVDNGDSQESFELVPQVEDRVFEKLRISFNNERVTRMVLHNTLGEKQVYEFSDLTYNADLPDDKFHFDPPEGVDVLDRDSGS